MKRITLVLIMLILICCAVNISTGEETLSRFDKYGGWLGLKGMKTGVFHTEKLNNRWWIITPEGNVFWSTGMYCVRISGIPETDTKKRPYNINCIKKYGNEREWARVTRKRLYNWGFNTIGDWSSQSAYHEPGLAYLIGIDLPRSSKNIFPQGHWGYFPDVFSKEFKDSVQKAMENRFKSQPYLIDDPWLLGYYLSDEPAWYGSKVKRGSLVDDFLALDASSSGKKAWVDFIRKKYTDIKELNLAWGSNYKNFDDLLTITKIKDNPSIEQDKMSFFGAIAEQFAKVLYEALRSFDKYHMILGTRPSRLYPEVVKALAKYSDIFSTSAYGFNRGYKIDQEFEEKILEIYNNSNKPILLGVSIPAQDVGYPYGIVKTQKDRGISYWRYLEKLASNPYIVGVHWFQYFDPPKKCYDKQAANWGLVNQNDEPYQEAVDSIIQANKMLYSYVLGLSGFIPEFGDNVISEKPSSDKENKAEVKEIKISLKDPGFENKNAWKYQTWKGNGKASFDYFTKHSGLSSLKIQGGTGEGWSSVTVGIQSKPNIILKPGDNYKLSVWIKTKDVGGSALIRFKVKYNTGGESYFETQAAEGTQNWKKFETKFTPQEENKVEYLAARLVGTGTAWFDDISLEQIE